MWTVSELLMMKKTRKRNAQNIKPVQRPKTINQRVAMYLNNYCQAQVQILSPKTKSKGQAFFCFEELGQEFNEPGSSF